MALGRLDEAKVFLKSAASHGISGNLLHRFALNIAEAEHDDATIAGETQFLQSSPGGQRMLHFRAVNQNLQSGRLREAEKMTRDLSGEYLRSSLKDEAARNYLSLANLQYYAGYPRLSNQNLEAALKISDGIDAVQYAAAIFAANGDEKRARALLAPLLKDNPDDERLQRNSSMIEAIILYNHAKYSDAADLLRPYETYARADSDAGLLLGYAKLRAGQPAEALTELQKNWSSRFQRPFDYNVP